MSLPFDVLNIILEYDGRMKYSYKRCIYVNIISKNDYRYSIIESNINNKLNTLENIEKSGLEFYIDIFFENEKGLIYDFNWSYENCFEICYYNLKNNNKHRIICE